MLNFKQAIEMAFRRWKDWEGRSNRAEFWWFFLFYCLVGAVLSLFAGDDDPSLVLGFVAMVVAVVNFVVMLGLSVRRLHDTGRSGWWILISFIPFVGAIVLLIFYAQKGEVLPNRFGPPHEIADVKIEIL